MSNYTKQYKVIYFPGMCPKAIWQPVALTTWPRTGGAAATSLFILCGCILHLCWPSFTHTGSLYR